MYSEAFQYYLGQAKKYWLEQNLYMEGMICLALHRYDDKVNASIDDQIIQRTGT